MHIVVAGNIGAGKTTLVKKLSNHYNWHPHYEVVDQNPYLEDFYKDMAKYAFPLQIFFLHSRFNQIREILEKGVKTIQDRSIYEDAHIFAKNLHKSGFISNRDFENYFSLFNSMTSVVRPPDLLIYLKADIPTLQSRIKMRGRDYESSIHPDYLRDLNEHYNEWIDNYTLGKVLTVDVNQLDYAKKESDLTFVIDNIDNHLKSIFRKVQTS